jgi:hypothetical protein
MERGLVAAQGDAYLDRPFESTGVLGAVWYA